MGCWDGIYPFPDVGQRALTRGEHQVLQPPTESPAGQLRDWGNERKSMMLLPELLSWNHG